MVIRERESFQNLSHWLNLSIFQFKVHFRHLQDTKNKKFILNLYIDTQLCVSGKEETKLSLTDRVCLKKWKHEGRATSRLTHTNEVMWVEKRFNLINWQRPLLFLISRLCSDFQNVACCLKDPVSASQEFSCIYPRLR